MKPLTERNGEKLKQTCIPENVSETKENSSVYEFTCSQENIPKHRIKRKRKYETSATTPAKKRAKNDENVLNTRSSIREKTPFNRFTKLTLPNTSYSYFTTPTPCKHKRVSTRGLLHCSTPKNSGMKQLPRKFTIDRNIETSVGKDERKMKQDASICKIFNNLSTCNSKTDVNMNSDRSSISEQSSNLNASAPKIESRSDHFEAPKADASYAAEERLDLNMGIITEIKSVSGHMEVSATDSGFDSYLFNDEDSDCIDECSSTEQSKTMMFEGAQNVFKKESEYADEFKAQSHQDPSNEESNETLNVSCKYGKSYVKKSRSNPSNVLLTPPDIDFWLNKSMTLSGKKPKNIGRGSFSVLKQADSKAATKALKREAINQRRSKEDEKKFKAAAEAMNATFREIEKYQLIIE